MSRIPNDEVINVKMPFQDQICLCGSKFWNTQVAFDDDWNVAAYLFDVICSACGSTMTIPPPNDENLVTV